MNKISLLLLERERGPFERYWVWPLIIPLGKQGVASYLRSLKVKFLIDL